MKLTEVSKQHGSEAVLFKKKKKKEKKKKKIWQGCDVK